MATRRMTITGLLGLIDTDDRWELGEDGELSDRNGECPLWHVWNAHGHYESDDEEYPEDYVEAGRRLGLSTRDAVAVAQAADNRGHPRLRKRLLSLVGVESDK